VVFFKNFGGCLLFFFTPPPPPPQPPALSAKKVVPPLPFRENLPLSKKATNICKKSRKFQKKITLSR
jgi:hypothetical protein